MSGIGPSTQGERDQALAVVREDLTNLVTRVRLVRNAFDLGTPTYDELHAIWEDACAALGGVNGLLAPRPVRAGGPVLGPPDPDEDPEGFCHYHEQRRHRLVGKAAAANDHSLDSEPEGRA